MCGKNLSTNQEHFPTALVIVIVPRYLAKKDNHLRKIKLVTTSPVLSWGTGKTGFTNLWDRFDAPFQ